MRTIVVLLVAALLPLPGQTPVTKGNALQLRKQSDREIVLERKFTGSLQAVFDSLTQPTHLAHWMVPANMSLISCEVDLRTHGRFRYVFQRGRGAVIEVRGQYEMVDPPRFLAYLETYGFSPLQVTVATTLEQVGNETWFKQTLQYPSQQERDTDFEGVATSAAELYGNLERYLGSRR